jgi:radical SAM protein with 4Fe4S-binding SPASM domain
LLPPIDPLEFPERLTLELTNACNLRCAMCPSRLRPEEPRGMMDHRLFERLIDEAAEHLPVALVPFFRGESLLHPRLVPLLAYAKYRGIGPIQLVTNGTLLTDTLAGQLLDMGLDFISFSLDTVRPAEYALIRRGGDFDQVMANVLGFLESRERGGHHTEVQVSATRSAANRESIEEFTGFWRGKADRVRIYYEHSADGHPGSLDCPEVPADMPRRACRKPFRDLVVYWSGEVCACNHDWYRRPPLGDLTAHSIAEVWHGPAYAELRRQHLEPERLFDPTCRHCDHWKMYYLPQQMVGELYTRTTTAALPVPPEGELPYRGA